MAINDQEAEVRDWLRRVEAAPGNAGHPLMGEFAALAEQHLKLLRQLGKITKISDRLQRETIELAQEQRQFVAMVSHEFRTPLAIIDSAAQMLEKEAAPGGLARLRKIRDAVRRMLQLIQSCLADDRVDQAHVLVRSGRVDMAALLDDLLEDKRGIGRLERLVLERPPAMPEVRGDGELLSVVVSNLIDNALKFSDPDTTVTVRAEAGPDAVRIVVADRGIGFGAEDGRRIFEKYVRASNAAGTAGAGLGLYLVRRIVEAHGGRIAVESAPGAGSTFTVTLPLPQAMGD
ncbi:MAG TPA: HAMP domain-containing sensor histidine kinase [Alphaproteobacteria bacterium]|nr:HAMP domain-containing sensor histidine kinase [Alphaproteobacteria bacterium]